MQVASGFNCLEFVDSDQTPEDGVACYEHDRTQGPACSISCGAAAVFRNYFTCVHSSGTTMQEGQTATRMLNGLDELLDDVGVPLGELCVKAGVLALGRLRSLGRLRTVCFAVHRPSVSCLRSTVSLIAAGVSMEHVFAVSSSGRSDAARS